MSNRIPFHKPYTSASDLVSLLQSRGLTVTDTVKAERYLEHITDTLRIYFDLCIIKYFLNIISPNNDMRDKIEALLSDFPSIDINAMGFPRGWENEPLWQ